MELAGVSADAPFQMLNAVVWTEENCGVWSRHEMSNRDATAPIELREYKSMIGELRIRTINCG
jgi:hypothetical protein